MQKIIFICIVCVIYFTPTKCFSINFAEIAPDISYELTRTEKNDKIQIKSDIADSISANILVASVYLQDARAGIDKASNLQECRNFLSIACELYKKHYRSGFFKEGELYLLIKQKVNSSKTIVTFPSCITDNPY